MFSDWSDRRPCGVHADAGFAESIPRYERVWADVPRSHVPYVSLLKAQQREKD